MGPCKIKDYNTSLVIKSSGMLLWSTMPLKEAHPIFLVGNKVIDQGENGREIKIVRI